MDRFYIQISSKDEFVPLSFKELFTAILRLGSNKLIWYLGAIMSGYFQWIVFFSKKKGFLHGMNHGNLRSIVFM